MEPRGVKKKKKICVVTTNRSDYGRMKPIMKAIGDRDDLELQVAAGTPFFFDHLFWYMRHGEPLSFWKSLPWHTRSRAMAFFGRDTELQNKEQLMRLLVADGFPIHARIPLFLEGGNLRVMAKTVGLALLGVPDVFAKLNPDIVLMNGDRFELLPIAFATVSLNIPLAHIEGGDVSGTIDESVRHAITKLAHIHFPATKMSGDRIRAMGEDPARIIVTGSSIIDTLAGLDLALDNSIYDRYYIAGDRIDFTKPYLLILQHPVTTRYEENKQEMEEIIAAVRDLAMQKIFLDPNIDGGSDGVSVALRRYRDERPPGAAFGKYFRPHDFYRIIANAAALVGNSSSFIRESAFLGTPVVIVGDRQVGRERGENAIEVRCNRQDILSAIEVQMKHGRYPRSNIFGDGTASEKIVSALAGMDAGGISLQKRFFDQNGNS